MRNKIILFLAVLLLSACSSHKDQPLFKEGRQFVYALARYENGQLSARDTISFKTGGFSIFNLASNGTKITWYDSRGQQISSKTVTTTFSNQDTSYSLDMPANCALLENEMVSLPGYPSARLKSKPGDISFTESSLVVGSGKLDGSALKQEKRHLSDSSILWNGKNYPVQRYESRNVLDTTELGVATLNYNFNKDIGFVNLDYHFPDGVEVKMELIKITESE